MKMERNVNGIGYLGMNGMTMKKRLKMDKLKCEDCGDSIEDFDEVILVPFLNSAYCEHCGTERMIDCKTDNSAEVRYQFMVEDTFRKKFSFD